MARAIRLSRRMIRRPNALAKVIAAAATVHQTKITHTDGQPRFPFILQEAGQLGDQIREDITEEGRFLLHAAEGNRTDRLSAMRAARHDPQKASSPVLRL